VAGIRRWQHHRGWHQAVIACNTALGVELPEERPGQPQSQQQPGQGQGQQEQGQAQEQPQPQQPQQAPPPVDLAPLLASAAAYTSADSLIHALLRSLPAKYRTKAAAVATVQTFGALAEGRSQAVLFCWQLSCSQRAQLMESLMLRCELMAILYNGMTGVPTVMQAQVAGRKLVMRNIDVIGQSDY
jgi:hypothetical protein